MIISDVGKKSALYDDYGTRMTPAFDKITSYGKDYEVTDSISVTYFKKTTDVHIHFMLNEKGNVKSSIYNDYFNNSDYISSLDNYDKYINNLKNRIYFHSMHEYFNKNKGLKKKIK